MVFIIHTSLTFSGDKQEGAIHTEVKVLLKLWFLLITSHKTAGCIYVNL